MSSSLASKCSVEPGLAEDVGIILIVLGEMRTAFGVKGGGHATNQGFSSMTAVIGAGNIWDDVYDVLNAQGVNTVSKRVLGTGVAGFTLGGRYSWLSNQYGLAFDNVITYELVVPNGTVVTVMEGRDPDLSFSLKGGSNNYGIVTQFILKTHPQGAIWGGMTLYDASYISAFTAASVKFSSEVTDLKAGMIMAYGYTNGQVFLSSTMFYDGPTPLEGVFDDFLAIPALTQDVMTRSKFSDLINATAPTMNATARFWTVYDHIPMLNYSESVIDSIIDEVNFWGPMLSVHGATIISYTVEPFLLSLLSHAPVGSSAYPSSWDHVAFPTNLDFQWILENEDEVFHDAARQTVQRLGAQGKSIYLNYVIYGTPVVDMFSDEGLKRMKATRKRVDLLRFIHILPDFPHLSAQALIFVYLITTI
ncbi:FAD dependent oxidoreductase [Armillaria novae-zelandiae]|uniref:FAD dependent oxidoreductase n=1 Tax=Armillaria novae-zelandiae TaxID=153914 RepID=A0AA39U7J9_9AGAR|nr:FAD dependent oxidoreductase [Armillaria novae-zelandiae]